MARICLKSLSQDDEGMFKVVFLQHVCNTYLVYSCPGSSIESGSRSHHDGSSLIFKRLKTPAAELLGVVDRQFRHGVECSHRDRGVDTGYSVETVYKAFAALHIFIVYVSMIFLWSIK